MRSCIVCVGGTGQILLHYYVQLYLLGVVQEPFDAVVIDSDDLLPSLSSARDFLDLLWYGQVPGRGLGVEVARIRDFKITPPAGTPAEALSGLPDEDLPAAHPARAFFDRGSLQQDLINGLFARPALSAVITGSVVPYDAVDLSSGQTVVVVGSVIGGTGGGLLVPVLDRLQDRANREGLDVKLRAVVVGEYFRAQAGLLAGDQGRFKSNQMLVMHSVKESLESLHSFALIGGPGTRLIARDPNLEKVGNHLPWPDEEGHPFWRGLQALQFLSTDVVMERCQAFDEREVGPSAYQRTARRASAGERLRAGLGVAREMVSRGVVRRLASECAAEAVWGGGLVSVLVHYWQLAARVAGGFSTAAAFPGTVQAELSRLLEGAGGRRGLKALFPISDTLDDCRPSSIVRIHWPNPREAGQINPGLFPSAEIVARRAAATMIFWALREGR